MTDEAKKEAERIISMLYNPSPMSPMGARDAVNCVGRALEDYAHLRLTEHLRKKAEEHKKGWIVMCVQFGYYQIAWSEEGLVHNVSVVIGKADEYAAKNDCERPHIDVYELGDSVNVRLKRVLESIEPREMPQHPGR